MTSNLACVGLAVDGGEDELGDLVTRALPLADEVGAVGEFRILRWQDASGSRLVFGLEDGVLIDMLPSFDGVPGVTLDKCQAVNVDVASAAVVDDDGEQLTAMTLELEQMRAVQGRDPLPPTRVSVVALGVDVTWYADESAFAAAGSGFASNSFVSYGVFGEDEDAEAYAQLNGTVLSAELRRNELTGQDFVVARVSNLCGEVDVCAPWAGDAVPAAGSIVGGTVFLVGCLEGVPFST